MSQIKCNACGTWNKQNIENCSECGEMLDRKKANFIRLAKEGKLPKKLKPSPLFEIKANDPWWKKTILYIVRPIYWTFFGIVSFLLYLVAWVAA